MNPIMKNREEIVCPQLTSNETRHVKSFLAAVYYYGVNFLRDVLDDTRKCDTLRAKQIAESTVRTFKEGLGEEPEVAE